MGLSASEILDVIGRSDRCYQMIRGYVAERHLEKYLKNLVGRGEIDDYDYLNADGQPDFRVTRRSKSKTIECKNVMKSFAYANGDMKVDFQRTRNQLEGKAGRYYKPGDFDILAACEFNQTGDWEFSFGRTRDLPQETVEGVRCIRKAVRLPQSLEGTIWTHDLTAVL